MNKPRKYIKRRPFKEKIPNKRFTFMLVPDCSANAKIRRLSMSYKAFGISLLSIILVPLLTITVLIMLLVSLTDDMHVLTSKHEAQHTQSMERINELSDERDRIAQELTDAQAGLEKAREDSQTANAMLDEFDDEILRLLTMIDDIERTKQKILGIFSELQQTHNLNIPYEFDHTVLTDSGIGNISRPDAGNNREIFAGADTVLANNLLHYRELEAFTAQLSAFFRFRPAGLPVPGARTGDGYGIRTSPMNADNTELHTGIDVDADFGDEIFATADGIVTYSDWNTGGYGYLVIISHGYGYSTYYAHNSALLVSEGDEVVRGQPVALAGNTGTVTATHCHYEIRRNGIAIDPSPFIHGTESGID